LSFAARAVAGHLQASGLFRELSLGAETGQAANVFGWGARLTGASNPLQNDEFSAQVK
jgi:hypothetical protein